MEIKNRVNGDHEEEIKNMIKKKRSRGMHVIGVVLYMLRRKRMRKPFSNGNFWRRIVESVRQLKNDNITSNIPILLSSSVGNRTSENIGPKLLAKEEVQEDQLSDMVEVFTATSSSSSSGISGYGSAKSLHDMDCLDEDDDYDDDDDDDDEEEEEEECYGDNDDGGDEMIDVKAEEFIVKFYEQMRMQNQAYTERYKGKGMVVV